jgi:hypothetical protein
MRPSEKPIRLIKLTLPKHPHTGLKIFCMTCRVDNPNCKHYTNQVYRIRVHVPGTGSGVKTKFLTSTEYGDAVLETLQFQKELSSNNFNPPIEKTDVEKDYNIVWVLSQNTTSTYRINPFTLT